jgi:hypothetical protein
MALAALMVLASALSLAWVQAQPQSGSDVAVIFPPWMAREHALPRIAAAGGLAVRQGVIDTIFVVHGDAPDLVHRLYAAGAWAVVDPVAFGGCLVPAGGRS